MRRFEFVQGSSAKFWMADVEGTNFVVVYGRLGTAGQRKDKGFPSEEAARRELEKKIAEKLREGYHEVAAGTSAPQGAKGAAAAAPRLELPQRVQPVAADQEAAAAAAQALEALLQSLGGRSWVVAQRERQALRLLDGVAGQDPGTSPLGRALDAVLDRVVAPPGTPRLALRLALGLLYKLDIAAFQRAVERWRKAQQAPPWVAVLLRQFDELDQPELALRVGRLLCSRPEHGGSELSWTRRWRDLLPHIEGYLSGKGMTLQKYLQGIDATGDPFMAQRVQRMGQRAA